MHHRAFIDRVVFVDIKNILDLESRRMISQVWVNSSGWKLVGRNENEPEAGLREGHHLSTRLFSLGKQSIFLTIVHIFLAVAKCLTEINLGLF